MANGLLVWVVVVGLAVVLGLPRRITFALTIVGVVTVFSFLWHFEFSTRGSLSDPAGIVKFVAVYLGSAVWGAGETAAALVGGIGLALVLAAVRPRVEGSRGPVRRRCRSARGVGAFVVLDGDTDRRRPTGSRHGAGSVLPLLDRELHLLARADGRDSFRRYASASAPSLWLHRRVSAGAAVIGARAWATGRFLRARSCPRSCSGES